MKSSVDVLVNLQRGPSQLIVKSAVGVSLGITTFLDSVSLSPSSSVTVRLTVYVPGLSYVTSAVRPDPLAVPPQLWSRLAKDVKSSVDSLVNVQCACPPLFGHLYVKLATGG